jgi:exosortase/archaeosortase family protein
MTAIQEQNSFVLSITITFWLMAIFTLFFLWFKMHKRIILSGLSKYKINIKLLENDFRVILFIYLFIVIISLLTEIFEYKIWIGFLFTSAQKILAVLGYEATVDGVLLIGTNGTIIMSKACLGFQMMLLFVVMIIMTGNNNRYRWIYIIIGLLFLNFINILRFVLLFIHLQNHGNYILSIEAHNLYNYLTYAIVFIIWVIWFEKFADFKTNASISNQ